MHRELFPPEHGRNGPAPADRNSPLRQVLAAPPGVTPGYWPVPPRRTRMSWRGSWLAKYGAAARPRHIVARISRLYRLQRTRGRPWQTGPPGKSFTIILAIPEFLPLASTIQGWVEAGY